MFLSLFLFFFFKQKTAYEMRISDWSSDVCSSDLSNVGLTIGPGEVVGLMGDNGAGKSTLVKIIAGNFPPTSGKIVVEGAPVEFHRPVDARAIGIEMVYQELALADNLTAAANVFLGQIGRAHV